MKKALKTLALIIILLLVVALIAYLYLGKGRYIKQPKLPGEIVSETIMIDGIHREFMWYKPLNPSPKSIVFILHGTIQEGQDMREETGYTFELLAEDKGFVPVYPTGYYNHWNDCRASADYKANIENVDDIKFLKEIEKHISAQLNLSFDNRFATGHSNGGHLCFKLAYEVPDWIDGIAPISANLPDEKNLDCLRKDLFVPMMLINGTADKMNLYNGGIVVVFGNDSRGIVHSTEETINYWSNLGNCTSTPIVKELVDKDPDDGCHVLQYDWYCDNKNTLRLLKIQDGGHTIPHPVNEMPRILGITNHDINAAEEIWDFFENIALQKQTIPQTPN